MKNTRYKAEMTLLGKKDDNGLFSEKKQVTLLDILLLEEKGHVVTISLAYEGKKRTPYMYTATYEGIITPLTTTQKGAEKQKIDDLQKVPVATYVELYKAHKLI